MLQWLIREKSVEINGLQGKVTTDFGQIGQREISVHMCEISGKKKNQTSKWIFSFLNKAMALT